MADPSLTFWSHLFVLFSLFTSVRIDQPPFSSSNVQLFSFQNYYVVSSAYTTPKPQSLRSQQKIHFLKESPRMCLDISHQDAHTTQPLSLNLPQELLFKCVMCNCLECKPMKVENHLILPVGCPQCQGQGLAHRIKDASLIFAE